MERWNLYDDASKDIIIHHPFYGYILGKTEKRFTNEEEFMLGITINNATARPSMYINKESVDETIKRLGIKDYYLQIDFMRDLITHELDHFILGHLWSVKKSDPKYVHVIKNIAMDSVINGHLKTIKEHSIPADKFVDMMIYGGSALNEEDSYVGPHSKFDDPTWEEVFADLMKKAGPHAEKVMEQAKKMLKKMKQKGKKQCGSNNGKNGQQNSDGEGNEDGKSPAGCTLDDHSGFDSEKNEMNQAYAKKIVQEAMNRGTVPGHLSSAVKELLKSKVNWRRYIRRFIGKGSVERKRETLMRRNRRFLKRADVPGNVLDEYGKLAVLVDTSASVSDRNLQEFFAEIDKIAQLLKKVWLIQYDAEVTDVRKYKRGAWRKLEIKGRGGTNMRPAIDKAIEKNCKRAIVLTDGYDDFPDDKIDEIKLMFALTDNKYEGFEEVAKDRVGKNNVFVLEDKK